MTEQTVTVPKQIKKSKTYTKTQVGIVIVPWAMVALSVAFFVGAHWGNWATNNTNERIQAEAASLVSELKVSE